MTTPIYDPNIPQFPGDGLATTQQQFLDNFITLYNVFQNNHVPLDSSTNIGNHKLVQLLERAMPIQTDLGDITAYSKDVEAQTDQLFLRYQGNGQEFQYTNYQLYSISATAFFTILPGGIIIYFGSIGAGVLSITLRPAIAKNIITIALSPNSNSTVLNAGGAGAVLVPPVNGIYTTVGIGAGLPKQPPYFYLIMANT